MQPEKLNQDKLTDIGEESNCDRIDKDVSEFMLEK